MKNKNVVLGTDNQPIHSSIAIHPGEVVKDEIEARNLRKTTVAKSLGMQPGHLSELFSGKRNISPAIALKLQMLLGISAETWLIFQNDYDLTTLRALLAKKSTPA